MSIAGNIYDGGGHKGASFPKVGDTYEGTITAIVEKQLIKFGTESTLETWPSGDPKTTPIITIQTTLAEDPDDDGLRNVYLRSGAFTAFGAALREAFDHKPTDAEIVGSTLKLRLDHTVPTSKGSDRKVYLCRLTPSSTTADAWDETPAGQPPQPPPDDGGFDHVPF